MKENPFTTAARELLAMPDEELAKLFEEVASEPSDSFLEFTAECFVGTPVND